MHSRNGCLRSLEVTVRFIKATDKHRSTVSQVKDHWYGSMVGDFNNSSSHSWVFIKIEFCVCEFSAVK